MITWAGQEIGRRDLGRGRREQRKPCEKIDGAVSIKCHFA
jgi:hypothetical protein